MSFPDTALGNSSNRVTHGPEPVTVAIAVTVPQGTVRVVPGRRVRNVRGVGGIKSLTAPYPGPVPRNARGVASSAERFSPCRGRGVSKPGRMAVGNGPHKSNNLRKYLFLKCVLTPATMRGSYIRSSTASQTGVRASRSAERRTFPASSRSGVALNSMLRGIL